MRYIKKPVIWGISIVIVFTVAMIIFLCWYFFTGTTQEPEEPSVPQPTMPALPTLTPQPTVEPIKPEKPIITFQDDIRLNIKGDDYVNPECFDEGVLGMDDYEQYYGTWVYDYEFSNGFYVINTDRYSTAGSNPSDGYVSSKETGVTCIIWEVNPLETTQEEVREKFLKEYWFTDYLKLGKVEDFDESKVELDVGYNGWEDKWPELRKDPTMAGCQVVADDMRECSYGNVQWTVVYSPYTERFEARAVITCDRDRLLVLNIEGKVLSDMWSTLREITNEVIRMVK